MRAPILDLEMEIETLEGIIPQLPTQEAQFMYSQRIGALRVAIGILQCYELWAEEEFKHEADQPG